MREYNDVQRIANCMKVYYQILQTIIHREIAINIIYLFLLLFPLLLLLLPLSFRKLISFCFELFLLFLILVPVIIPFFPSIQCIYWLQLFHNMYISFLFGLSSANWMFELRARNICVKISLTQKTEICKD